MTSDPSDSSGPAESNSPESDAAREQQQRELLQREAHFWDVQEEQIESLYQRPHDWRLVPDLAERIIQPRIDRIGKLLRQYKITSMLDVGCGNGWFCHGCADQEGIRSYGVDLSQKKIDEAWRLAKERNLEGLCHFEAKDVMDFEIPEKVDLLTSHGSLHHFPDLEHQLPEMVDRFLKPGGYMLFIEPHYEGMSPGIREFVLKMVNSKLFGRFFDVDFYLEVSRRQSLDGPEEEPEEGEVNIRGESPAGLEFFEDHPEMSDILKKDYDVLEEHYYHYFSGHFSNVFYIYQKSKIVRGIYRILLPLIVGLDTHMCRKPSSQEYAEEGLWFLRRAPGSQPKPRAQELL